MLASFPASMLNQKPSDLGILNRFKLDPSRSSAESAVCASPHVSIFTYSKSPGLLSMPTFGGEIQLA
jgi:hypothetical protein